MEHSCSCTCIISLSTLSTSIICMDIKKKEKEHMIIIFTLLIFTASSSLLPVFVLQKTLLKSQTQTGKLMSPTKVLCGLWMVMKSARMAYLGKNLPMLSHVCVFPHSPTEWHWLTPWLAYCAQGYSNIESATIVSKTLILFFLNI